MMLFSPFFFVGMDNQPSETRHRRKKMGRKRGGGESDEAFCKWCKTLDKSAMRFAVVFL